MIVLHSTDNTAGDLTQDENKSLTKIQYDYLGHPVRIQFRDGSCTKYVYAADGRKLREIHITAVEGVYANMGQIKELTPAQTMATDTVDYADNLVIRYMNLNEAGMHPKIEYHFDGGYMTLTPNPAYNPNPTAMNPYSVQYSSSYHYYIRNHQGNTILVMDDNDNIKQINHYYPYGGPWYYFSTNQGFQPYKYNGKELDRVHGLDWYDYGARRYDPAYCMFTQMDPLAEQYPHLSPYVYCAGNPVRYVDPDGRLIVFINGFHNGFEGASPSYWSNGFATAIMSHFNDYNSRYLDGSLGGIFGLNKYIITSNLNPWLRYNAGMAQGTTDAQAIFSTLKRDEYGNITEGIKLVSHSMGGAYAKGYAQALVNYIIKKPQTTSGVSISEYDFAPFQPNMQKAVWGVDTYQYSHKYDRIAGSKPIEGAHFMETSSSMKDGHPVSNFWQYIMNLPEGQYRFEQGRLVQTD